ncbi:MAG: OsmC family protein [Nitratireductor sp.]
MVNTVPMTSVKLRSKAECPSHSLTNVSVRDLEFAIDEPTQRGGTNKGPTPTDTALAALIGCTNVIAHKCAEALAIDIGHLEVSAVCVFNRLGVALEQEIEVPFEKIELKVVADGTASQEDLQRVAREVSKYCPLSKLFKNSGTIIEEDWQPKST